MNSAAASAASRDRRLRRIAGWLLIVLVASPVLGCTAFQTVGTEQWHATNWFHSGSERKVSHVLAIWDSRVRVTQDSVNGGRPLPGIVGRLHLMNEDSPIDARGTVTVLMHDVTHANVEPRAIASWEFNRESLKVLKRKDIVGDGYTLFLPWETYHPEVRKVQMQICYKADNGAPYYASPTILDLQAADAPQPVIHEKKIMPAGYTPPPGN